MRLFCILYIHTLTNPSSVLHTRNKLSLLVYMYRVMNNMHQNTQRKENFIYNLRGR